jgi:hypothetical protein
MKSPASKVAAVTKMSELLMPSPVTSIAIRKLATEASIRNSPAIFQAYH